ncbi:MAG: DAK2 domain-containing protein [Clostridia bacterium]|nr:DAK2 domain-containing protein [Clostridia bacterium]
MAFRFLDGTLFAKMFKGGAARLHSKAETVNNLNVFPVPDGDTGDNMSMTMDGGVNAISSNSEEENLGSVSDKLAHGMLLGARGNSGVILSQLFAGMSKVFDGCTKADVATVGKALKSGVKQAYSAVVTPTEGTILTVARESIDYAVSRITPDSTIESLFADVSKEMNESLQRTPELLAALREAGVIDSGGAGLVYIMEGFNMILSGQTVEDESGHGSAMANKAPAAIDFSAFDEDSVLEFGYCTECLLRLQNAKCNPKTFNEKVIVDYLKKIGNSIVCFKTDSIVKLHVHTQTPDKVLAFCQKFGEFLTIKIENMSVQHNETIPEEKPAPKPRKKYATIAVASGEGIQQLFRDLGADAIVSGGQTMNPSAEDFLKAFDEVNANVIFVLPNNSNIILAARQAAEIYTKSEVNVLESRTIGDGYAALSAINYESNDSSEIVSMFNDAMDSVVTGQVTISIRDTTLNNIEIKKDDYIGFVGKTMMASDPSELETVKKLLKSMELEDRFAITVLTGKDARQEDIDEIKTLLANDYSHLEVYIVDGQQEVYDYILIAE